LDVFIGGNTFFVSDPSKSISIVKMKALLYDNPSDVYKEIFKKNIYNDRTSTITVFIYNIYSI